MTQIQLCYGLGHTALENYQVTETLKFNFSISRAHSSRERGKKGLFCTKWTGSFFLFLHPTCQKAISKCEALCHSLLSPDYVTVICSPTINLLWHWLQDFPKEGRWRQYASSESNRKSIKLGRAHCQLMFPTPNSSNLFFFSYFRARGCIPPY